MKELVAVLFGVLLGGVVGCFAGVLIGLIMTIAGYYAGLDGGWSIVLSTVALVICAVFGIFLGPFVLISLLSSQPHTKLKF